MIEGKGLGGKRVDRFSVSLSNHNMSKLNRLAISCDTKTATLAAHMIEHCLNDLKFVNELQDRLNVHSAYRMTLIKNHQGNVVYMNNGAYQ